MDTLAHGLWTNVMYKFIPQTRNNRKITLWGIAFGVLPDLVSFTPIFVYSFWRVIFNGAHFGRPDFEGSIFSRYAEQSYQYTHSLVIWAVVLILAWIIWKKFPWIMLGWVLHIVIDIFTHPDFYRTPFLFPLSGYHNHYAISWAHPVFMIINYSLLFFFYIYLLPRIKKKITQTIP